MLHFPPHLAVLHPALPPVGAQRAAAAPPPGSQSPPRRHRGRAQQVSVPPQLRQLLALARHHLAHARRHPRRPLPLQLQSSGALQRTRRPQLRRLSQQRRMPATARSTTQQATEGVNRSLEEAPNLAAVIPGSARPSSCAASCSNFGHWSPTEAVRCAHCALPEV